MDIDDEKDITVDWSNGDLTPKGIQKSSNLPIQYTLNETTKIFTFTRVVVAVVVVVVIVVRIYAMILILLTEALQQTMG